MSALENSVFIEILKETVIFFTYMGEFLLKIFYYTPLKAPLYENH
jgi:hypothetical protein